MLEIEIKLRVDDLAAIRDKILKAGAVLTKERYREENILFDFRDHHLERQSQALRLRLVKKKAFLTFKGTPQRSRRFKVREEYETEVKNEKHLRQILKKLGLRATFSYSKHRTVFQKGKLKVCLDETPVGNFCELEGERPEIVRFARALGFTNKDFIKLDYVQMIKQRMAERQAAEIESVSSLNQKEANSREKKGCYSSSDSLSGKSSSSSSSSSSPSS